MIILLSGVLIGIIVRLVVGGIVGWLASIVMRTDGQQGLLLNVVVGIVGALLAGFIVSPLLGIATINQGLSVGAFGFADWSDHSAGHRQLVPSRRGAVR